MCHVDLRASTACLRYAKPAVECVSCAVCACSLVRTQNTAVKNNKRTTTAQQRCTRYSRTTAVAANETAGVQSGKGFLICQTTHNRSCPGFTRLQHPGWHDLCVLLLLLCEQCYPTALTAKLSDASASPLVGGKWCAVRGVAVSRWDVLCWCRCDDVSGVQMCAAWRADSRRNRASVPRHTNFGSDRRRLGSTKWSTTRAHCRLCMERPCPRVRILDRHYSRSFGQITTFPYVLRIFRGVRGIIF